MRVRTILGRGLGPVLLLALSAGIAAAQGPEAPAGAIQLRGWSFQTLEPGVPEVIPPLDPARHAEFVLVGSGVVEVQIVLPDALLSPEGARVPMSYGPLDGIFIAGPAATPVRFDPRERQRFVLPTGGEAVVYLGATARPAPDQMATRYSAPVTMVVTRPQS